jgi:lipid A disaccharide synthetase
VNIIGGREIVKELYGHHFTEEKLVDELELLLHYPEYRQNILAGYADVAKILGEPGAADHCARKLIKFIKGKREQLN